MAGTKPLHHVTFNPFDEDRADTLTDFRAEWDVPALNAEISSWLVDLVHQVRAHPEVTNTRKLAVILADAGYGKTHLLGRLARDLGNEVLIAFVGPIFEAQLTAPMSHIGWNVVEAMFDPPRPGAASTIALLLGRLTLPSFRDYFDRLPEQWRLKTSALRDHLHTDATAILRVIAGANDTAPFLDFAESMAKRFPSSPAEIIRALSLGWSPAAEEARRWLRGDDLSEAECDRLRLPAEPPEPERVIEACARLLQKGGMQLVICCDQLEAVLKNAEVGPINLTNGLIGLLSQVPNAQIILSCIDALWSKVVSEKVHGSFEARLHPQRKLEELTEDTAIELVRHRVHGWEGNADKGGTYPITAASIKEFVRSESKIPRMFLRTCRTHIDDWLERGTGEVDIIKPAQVSFPDVFIQHWNATLTRLQQKARSPADLQEAQIFQSVKEAIHIARAAGYVPPEMKVVDLKDSPIYPATSDPRYSLALHLDIGGKKHRLIVAVSKKDSGVAFGAYVAALETTLRPRDVLGGALIRPFTELKVGPGAVAKRTYDKLVEKGRMRPFPLGQERLTFDLLECLNEVLTAADEGLPLGGRELKRADCMKLIAENGLLKGLKLYELIFGNWNSDASVTSPATSVAAAEVVAPVSVSASPNIAAAGATANTAGQHAKTSAMAKGLTAAPTVSAVGVPRLPPRADSAPSVKAVDPISAWADDLLANVVAQYGKWGLPIRPLGVQIGPTFARLKVHPDSTDMNKVRSRAEYLRVSLGLSSIPMIGLQAGFISIDVQRNTRETVALAPVLKERDPKFAGAPIFPVGSDVAGKSHWLNLADTTNCHLLIAGTTGSGKSEFLKVILASLADQLNPQQLQFILIDPKRVTFNLSGKSEYLRAPIAYDHEEALPLVDQCAAEMERRYKLMFERRLTDVSQLTGVDSVPRIVLIFDEFADLMTDKESKRDLESLLKRLGAKARASGIHLILGTQRTEASVVTPLLRSNLPGRISLRVASDKDSKLILDSSGAEALLGRGDLLWRQGGELLRLQSPFVSNTDLETYLKVK